MKLPQLLQQQEEEFDKEFRHQDYCEHRDDAYKGCICGNDEMKSSHRSSIQAILRGVVEEIEGEERDMRYVGDGESFTTTEEKERINFRNRGYNQALSHPSSKESLYSFK